VASIVYRWKPLSCQDARSEGIKKDAGGEVFLAAKPGVLLTFLVDERVDLDVWTVFIVFDHGDGVGYCLPLEGVLHANPPEQGIVFDLDLADFMVLEDHDGFAIGGAG
jgi:hypothetical protein